MAVREPPALLSFESRTRLRLWCMIRGRSVFLFPDGVRFMSVLTMSVLEELETIRSAGGQGRTVGLSDVEIERFAATDRWLAEAVEAAAKEFESLQAEFPDLMAMEEQDQVAAIQSSIVNFYARDAVNPYVSLAARGPWIVTTKGRRGS